MQKNQPLVQEKISDSNATVRETKAASFAELVKGKKPYRLTDSDLIALPDATIFRDEPVLELPLEFTQEGRDLFQFSLIGRLNFRGLKLNEVQRCLEEQWKLGEGRCKLVPMTKGFFFIKLTTAEDKERVWHGDSWVVHQQTLRVINFFPNFDPERQSTSHAAVWVSFPGLFIELWTKKILISIGKVLGKPIAIDQKTLDHDVGNYAAVLIDIDFAKLIPKRIRLKANGNEFWQYVEIQDLENIKFCNHCKLMGHKFENCITARKILGGKLLAGNCSNEAETAQGKPIKESDTFRGDNKHSNYAWKEAGNAQDKTIKESDTFRGDNKHSKYDWKEVRGGKKNSKEADKVVASVDSMGQLNKEKGAVLSANSFEVLETDEESDVRTDDVLSDETNEAFVNEVDEEEQLANALVNSEIEFREAQMKLIRSKNAIAAHAVIAARTALDKPEVEAIMDVCPAICSREDQRANQHQSGSKEGDSQKVDGYLMTMGKKHNKREEVGCSSSKVPTQHDVDSTLGRVELKNMDDEDEEERGQLITSNDGKQVMQRQDMGKSNKVKNKDKGTVGGAEIQIKCTPTSNHEKVKDGKQVGGSGPQVAVENNCKPTLNKSTPINKESVYYMGLDSKEDNDSDLDNILTKEELEVASTMQLDEVRANFIRDPAFRQDYFKEKKEQMERMRTPIISKKQRKEKKKDELGCSSTKIPTPVQLAFRNGGHSNKSDTNEDIGQDIRARMRIHDEEVANKTKTQHGSNPMTIEDVDKLFPPEMENYETMRKLYKFQFDIT